MNYIHENEVNKRSERNLLHDILNPSKCTKILNIHYYPILHGCINTQKVRAKFKNFCILLDSGCSYTIIMRRLMKKLNPKRDDLMQYHTKVGNITTNLKVK